MRKLRTDRINLDNALRISSDNMDHNIWRFDLDAYAIVSCKTSEPICAFHSEAFSDLLKSLNSRITQISFTQGERLYCGAFDDIIEVWIVTENRDTYHIDCLDTVSICSDYAIPSFAASDIWQATDLLSLPPNYPLDRLLLTAGFTKEFIHYLYGDQGFEVLRRFWIDAQKSKRSSCFVAPVVIEGEYGTFAAKEELCGRVVLMCTKEISA